jgi:hypothetical protein
LVSALLRLRKQKKIRFFKKNRGVSGFHLSKKMNSAASQDGTILFSEIPRTKTRAV